MRHAKSSWDDSSQRDIERPLNKRGKREAPAMGIYLKNLGLVPDLVISSTAQRARETVLLISDVLNMNRNSITWNEDLYYRGARAYLKAIRRAPSAAETILLAGHNPTVEHLVSYLSAERTREVITTANIACFESLADKWSGIGPDNCTFKWLVRPNDIE